jgi:membrane protease YdiL (CAAX protease family)
VRSADGTAPRLRYHELQRLGHVGWFRAFAGVLLLTVAVLVVVQSVLLGLYAAIGEPFGDVSLDPLTPVGLFFIGASWAAAVPAAVLVTRWVQDVGAGWVVSVVGRIRWRWFFVCLGLAAVAIAVTVVVSLALPEQGGADVEGSANDITGRWIAFALIVVFLIPLQAAGEEFAFRGYLTQTVGGLFRGRIGTGLALVVPAGLFALAHGAQSLPVFLDRFAFGLVAGALVIITGGLEAGIAMHVVNNWVSFGIALIFGDMATAATPTVDTWWLLPATLVQSLGYLALVVVVARRRGVETATGPGVLERQRPRV